jgi:hypothetical protein
MKTKFKLLATTMLICGFAMTACGGGSKSGLSNNGVLGNLPGLYADMELYQADLEAQAEEWAKKMTSESGMKKAMEWSEKAMKEAQEKEAAFEEDVKAEWAKLDGKEVPFTVSDNLLFNVASVKLDAENQGFAALITAKQDLQRGQAGSDKYVYNILDKDGNVVHSQDIWFASRAYAAGETIKDADGRDYTAFTLSVDNAPKEYADFASIQFVPAK